MGNILLPAEASKTATIPQFAATLYVTQARRLAHGTQQLGAVTRAIPPLA